MQTYLNTTYGESMFFDISLHIDQFITCWKTCFYFWFACSQNLPVKSIGTHSGLSVVWRKGAKRSDLCQNRGTDQWWIWTASQACCIFFLPVNSYREPVFCYGEGVWIVFHSQALEDWTDPPPQILSLPFFGLSFEERFTTFNVQWIIKLNF